MLVFINNAETETLEALASLEANEARVDEVEVDPGSQGIFPTWLNAYDAEMDVTITDEANAPGEYEIARLRAVTITAGPTVKFTLARFADTSARAVWSSGASISARVTAQMLESFPQTESIAPDHVYTVRVGRYGVQRNITFGSLPALSVVAPFADEYRTHYSAKEYPAGAELIFRTRAVDIGVPAGYSDGSSYFHGVIVVPAVADGYQYQLLRSPDGRYNATGTVAFPGDGSEVEALTDDAPPEHVGWWIPTSTPIVLEESLPGDSFVLTEIGFLGSATGLSTPAVVSIGVTGDTTKFLDHGNISDGFTRLTVPIADSSDNDDLIFTVHTPADVSLVGNFFFRGFIIQSSVYA